MKPSEIEGIHCSDCPTTIAYCEKLETRIKELEYERDQLKFDLKEITGGLKDRIAMLEKSNAELHNQCEIYIEQLASARSEVERLRKALEKIRHEEGRVCNEYEVCNHSACKSSYNSWAIARQALGRSEG